MIIIMLGMIACTYVIFQTRYMFDLVGNLLDSALLYDLDHYLKSFYRPDAYEYQHPVLIDVFQEDIDAYVRSVVGYNPCYWTYEKKIVEDITSNFPGYKEYYQAIKEIPTFKDDVRLDRIKSLHDRLGKTIPDQLYIDTLRFMTNRSVQAPSMIMISNNPDN